MSEAAAAPQSEDDRNAQAAAKAAEYKEKFQSNVSDNAPAPQPDTAPVVHEKPEHVPEKFFNSETGEVNYEEWNKAHAALEAKFHEGSKNAPGESKETPADDESAAEGDSSAEAGILETPAAQQAAKEYAEFGKVSADSYAALEKQGITSEMVDSYIAGKEASANTIANAAFEPAGGEERYNAMLGWAAENLTEESKKAFNTQVTSGDPDVIRNAVTALANVFAESETVEGDRVGGAPSVSDSSTFASRKEMSTAINKVGPDGKRLYDTDPAYRTAVITKIGKSRKAGTVNF